MSFEIALFPLSQIVLPQGQMQLRIFEPRYQRLVREAGQRPFAMALLNPYVNQKHPQRIYPTVTQVTITDFVQLPDGLLGITIAGQQRLEVIERWQEDDGLHVAKVKPLENWPNQVLLPNEQIIAQELQQVFSHNPQLADLYPCCEWQSANWVAARWLEVLTMQPPLKHQLMAAADCQPSIAMLLQWLQQHAGDN